MTTSNGISLTGAAAPISGGTIKADISKASYSSFASFAQQLTSALTDILGNSTSASHIEIDANRDTGEAVIRISPTKALVATVSSSAAALLHNTPVNPPAAQNTLVAKASPVAGNNVVDAVDAYWAQFPPEVQKLRTIQDPTAREAEASRLAAAGNTIDFLTMVWGWHPVAAMKIRRESGWTWVPAMGQAPAQTPGVHFAGRADYDPNHPPPGSIKVSLDFAKGTFIDPMYFSDADALARELGGITSRNSVA